MNETSDAEYNEAKQKELWNRAGDELKVYEGRICFKYTCYCGSNPEIGQ